MKYFILDVILTTTAILAALETALDDVHINDANEVGLFIIIAILGLRLSFYSFKYEIKEDA